MMEGGRTLSEPEPVTGPWVYTETVYLLIPPNVLDLGEQSHQTAMCYNSDNQYGALIGQNY